MALFITGDVHGDIDWEKLNTRHFKAQRSLTREDILLVCGDFGAPWCIPESGQDKNILKWHEEKTYTTVFVDGNHENFSALKTYPVIRFRGALCNRIRPHVLHMMRGEVLEFEGHRILAMGGAASHDKEWRVEGLSWWPEEIPSEYEWLHAADALLSQKPDLIVTHDAPESVVRAMFEEEEEDRKHTPVTAWHELLLELIRRHGIPVTDWYFGHHHDDRIYRDGMITFRAMFQNIEKIAPTKN